MSNLNRNELVQTYQAYQRLLVSRQAVYAQLKRDGKQALAKELNKFQQQDKATMQRIKEQIQN